MLISRAWIYPISFAYPSFITSGLAISFISTAEDEAEMKKVQERFAVQVPEMPDQIDISTYSKLPCYPASSQSV